MTTTVLTTRDIAKHLVIEEDKRTGEPVIVCGAQNHYGKRPKAKRVQVDLTKPSKRIYEALPEGQYAEARDGVRLTIGSAYCGTHMPTGSEVVTIGVEMVAEFIDSNATAILDYAKGRYEAHLDEKEARQAEYQRRWALNRQQDHANPTFTVRVKDEERGGDFREWLIEGSDPDTRDGEVYPMTIVRLTLDGDRLWVGSSDYMNSGPGRGNPSWTAAFMEAMTEAARIQREHTASKESDA